MWHQVTTLKDQLTHELRQRHSFISRTSRAEDEVNDLRNVLDKSLTKVTRNPDLDPILLEHESRKLDNAIEYRKRSTSPAKVIRHPSPVRNLSPTRAPTRIAPPAKSNVRHSSPPLRSSLRK